MCYCAIAQLKTAADYEQKLCILETNPVLAKQQKLNIWKIWPSWAKAEF